MILQVPKYPSTLYTSVGGEVHQKVSQNEDSNFLDSPASDVKGDAKELGMMYFHVISYTPYSLPNTL